ncbi:hypothetical protein HU200_067611 [Digitaria exilis]|uniref:Uncharacterized protein n=1 Tax=Digitaria exilis TaxID=1010633 RepID=A0A835A5Q8_9POAL|nr:hypothetical protein HU200_067611 [Digitaria exilis]
MRDLLINDIFFYSIFSIYRATSISRATSPSCRISLHRYFSFSIASLSPTRLLLLFPRIFLLPHLSSTPHSNLGSIQSTVSDLGRASLNPPRGNRAEEDEFVGDAQSFVHRIDVCTAISEDLVANIQSMPGTNLAEDGYSAWYFYCPKRFKNAQGKTSRHRQLPITGGETCWHSYVEHMLFG